MREEWKNFKEGDWTKEINVSDFIQKNYEAYDGDESFLSGTSKKTKKVWNVCESLLQEELKVHVLDIDVDHMSGIDAFAPGYIDKKNEVIVGLQTDAPLKRIVNPYGGIRMVYQELESYGYSLNKDVDKYFNEFRKTHNQGVFDAYTTDIRKARHVGLLTGLPDAYGRGRIIGDYRRVALYGIDRLIEDKKEQFASLEGEMTPDKIQLREEISDQIKALKEMIELGNIYGYDISKPARNAKEAIQWLYFGFLAAVKEQNGAAMSIGRTSTFLDIYIERDLRDGIITESEAQEMIDHFIMKLRLVKFARTPEYNELFSGDPTWVTESIGGVGIDGRPLVTKNSFRYLHTLENLGTAPEPNLTVLWSKNLPHGFKEYCAHISITTSSIQYENDDMMRVTHGDDYAIACCVSSMVVGKEMQFFGARANLAKCLLYAINGGVDEISKAQIGPKYRPITSEYLDFNEVMDRYEDMMDWLADLYVNTLNVIHYMHDKYCYEKAQMALLDRDVKRYFATGIAGLSVVADSLSAIKYAKVKTIRDENGVVVDYQVEGEFPKYGNNDDRVDELAVNLVRSFMAKIRKHFTYRNSIPTMSILTITSNVVYGKKTGNTPDGRKQGVPLAPGANPMHGRDSNGVAASLSSVAKLPFEDAQDGISNTFSIIPNALGKDEIFMGDLNIQLDCGCCESNMN